MGFSDCPSGQFFDDFEVLCYSMIKKIKIQTYYRSAKNNPLKL